MRNIHNDSKASDKTSIDDVIYEAQRASISYDSDPVFMLICKEITGKTCLKKMNSRELSRVCSEVMNNPAVFTKLKDAANDGAFFKSNFDYDTGNFIDRVKIRNERYKE